MADAEMTDLRDEILGRWLDRVVEGYPEETARFLKERPDRFANPVGAGLREGLAELLDGVLSGAGPDDLEPAIDRVIRVRAVQEFSPSAAVGFIFELKNVVRSVCLESGRAATGAESTLDPRIERLGLHAFDVYMRCREQMWMIRAQEIRNQSVGIMERVAEWRARREEDKESVPRS